MPLSSGDKLGPYEIVAPLGVGGMGEVYRAIDTRLKREVAVKVLPEAFAHDPERLARFKREAEVLASLNHSHIATIHGLEERALVMELVEGESPHGPMSFDDAWRIASQIAAALEYAHDKGVVHRDLKPANMKVTPDGVVKLLDFGLAKAFSVQAQSQSSDPANSPTLTMGATQVGVILGTAAYMAPEQAKGRTIDKRADIWAFGVLLYELLTGEMLFQGVDVSDTLAHVLTKDPDLSKASPRSHKLLRRCLEKDPKKRLRDIGDAEALLEDHVGQVSPPISSRLPWAVAGTLAVALAAAVWVPWGVRGRDSPMSQFVILPPENASFFGPELESQAISPDGRQLVFGAAISGQRASLWLRPLESLAAHPLAGTEDAIQPFWSPDSRSIGFFAHGKLQRVDAAGGPAQPLADASLPLGGTWSPSGVIVFAPRLGALFRVPAGGGEASPVTHPEAGMEPGMEHRFPSFLPDGRHFLFQRFSPASQESEVDVGSLDSQNIKPIFRASSPALYSAPGYLLFLRESTLMAQRFDLGSLSTSGDPSAIAERISEFTVSGNRTLVLKPSSPAQTHLVWVDRTGKQISEAAPPANYGFVDLSRDGKRVAFDGMASSRFEVWLRDLERGISTRLTFQPSNVPLWSPDGGTVVFASNSNGLDLSQRPSNMSAPEAVLLKLNAPPFLFPSDWSSDGSYLAYFRTDPKTRLDQWVLPMFGDRQPLAFLHGDFNESQGQFSPDGKWMAYVSDESGTPQVNVVSFPTPAGIRQVSTAGGSQPRWRRDGKELFYIALDHKLMSVSVKTGVTFEAETPHPLFVTTLPTSPLRQAYSVSPDGQRFLLTAPLEVSSALTLIQSWTAGLRK